jgi:hypothetical protein
MDIIIGSAVIFAVITAMCAVFALKLPQEKFRMYFFILTILSGMGGLAFMMSAPGITTSTVTDHMNVTADGLVWNETAVTTIIMSESTAGALTGIYQVLLATLTFIFAIVCIMLIVDFFGIWEKMKVRW